MTNTAETVHALKRFGHFAKPGDFARVSSDPRGYVLSQINQGLPKLFWDAAPTKLAEQWADFKTYQAARKRLQVEAVDNKTIRKELGPSPLTARFQADQHLMFDRASTSETPILERLASFWGDHFNVSRRSQPLAMALGHYHETAIRPHILGSFKDMLQAVVHHPAMLSYLDNTRSIGPNSRQGKKRNKGLNENLAREILELHTLGVGGPYTQNDVTSFAKILTGWTNGPRKKNKQFSFLFARPRHEPGTHTLLGQSFMDTGLAQGEAALDMLANHPATAKFVASRLTEHFLSDTPPENVVKAAEMAFLNSDGDLPSVYKAIINHDESWSLKPSKTTSPFEFAVGLSRAFDVSLKPHQVRRLLKSLGQETWKAPSPAGWPQENNAWLSPDALMERLDLAANLSRLVQPDLDIIAASENQFGDELAKDLAFHLTNAADRRQAISLLAMSPQFQMR